MAYLRVLDESTPVQDYCVAMDFQGAGVTVTRPSNNDSVVVTIPSAAAVTGWTDDGAIVRLTTIGDAVAIGAAVQAGTEKVRVVNVAGVAIRSEGRLDLPNVGVAAAAASQAASYVQRFTASMWTGAAAADRDFDQYAAPSSLLLNEAGGAFAILATDLEGTRIKNLSNGFEELRGTTVGAAAPEHRFSHAKAQIGSNGDPVGIVSFWGPDTSVTFDQTHYADIRGVIHSAADTAESGRVEVWTMVAGTFGRAVRIRGGSVGAEQHAIFQSDGAAGLGVAAFGFDAGANYADGAPVFYIRDNVLAAATTLWSVDGVGTTTNTGGQILAGTISPAALAAGPTQNYAPANFAAAFGLRLTADAAGTSALGGLAGGIAGRIVAIFNISAFNLTLNHADGGSAAANQFVLPGAANHIIAAGDCALIWYDGVTASWRLMAQA